MDEDMGESGFGVIIAPHLILTYQCRKTWPRLQIIFIQSYAGGGWIWRQDICT